jgi:hypothetical protein
MMSGIDVTRLTCIFQKEGKTVARCPACAERGGDTKGNNLVVFKDGKFGCAAYPSDRAHNRAILKLAGGESDNGRIWHVPVRPVIHPPSRVIRVVGRLGRSFTTPTQEMKLKGGALGEFGHGGRGFACPQPKDDGAQCC